MPVKPEDAQRYNEICLQYYDAILSFCNARMGFRLEDAKDCTQQVFQLLLEKLPYLDTEKNILAWLYRVARNMIARYYDQCKKEADKILYLDGLTDREETMAHLVTVDAYPVDKEEEWDEDKLNTVKEEVLQHLDMETAGAAVRPKTELSADNRPDKCFGELAAAKDLRFEKPHQKDRQSNIKIVQE